MNVLIITYWSFKEPLIQAATLPYLEQMREAIGPDAKLHLLTLEKDRFKATSEEEKAIHDKLKNQGVTWLHKRYYKFGLRAIFAWFSNLISLRSYCRRNKIDAIHAFGSPAATSAHIIHSLTGIPYVIDSYEPHAESMVENGSWKKGSLAHRVLRWFEYRQTRKAAAVLATTEGMREYAAKTYQHIPGVFITKPASVDLDVFSRNRGTNLSRAELGIPEHDVVAVYAGKVGGIYLKEETFDFFATCAKYWEGRFSILLLSDISEEELRGQLQRSGLDPQKVTLRFAPHAEVPDYLALADFAINPVKPVPSKRYCTSIKDGEYWAMGLPVAIPPNISDDSDLIEREGIGAVIKSFDETGYTHAVTRIDGLLKSRDVSELSERIRSIAIKHRSIENAREGYRKIYSPEGVLRTPSKSFLVLIYNSFKDPLFQNLMYEYLQEQSRLHPHYRFELITFEQKKYALSKIEQLNEKAFLSGERIYWHPLTYHSGSFMFLKKSVDFVAALSKVVSISLRRRSTMIIAFANASASISYLLTKLTRSKLMVYSYEPHSAFLAEFGIWKKSGWRYRILNSLEQKVAEESDYILTGTKHMVQELEGIAKGEVLRAPSSVDPDIFCFNEESRRLIRQELNIEDRKVLIYAGKFGGIYYDKEIGQFFKALHEEDPNWYFIVLSPSSREEVEAVMENAKLSKIDYHLHEAFGAEEVADWLSAADVGLNAIPPYPNQRFRSPVKVGEYLMCGLPYITCAGVSEDDEWALEHHVGVVINKISSEEALSVNQRVDEFLKEPRKKLRLRCRETGIAYRGRKQVDEAFEKCLADA